MQTQELLFTEISNEEAAVIQGGGFFSKLVKKVVSFTQKHPVITAAVIGAGKGIFGKLF
jgi:hypothetical protein